MNIKELQDKIREFDRARGWEDNWNIKDLLLNITEEGGEFWNLIKWIDDEKQKQILNEKKDEVENYIGDTLFLLLKIANQTKVNAQKALEDTSEEYEKRMPSEKMREVKHANKLTGGVDDKNEN